MHLRNDSRLPQSTPIPSSPSDTRLLTFDDVAAILRTSRKAVYAMRARGQLPAVIKVGRRVLMREADLLAWLAERVVSPMESRR